MNATRATVNDDGDERAPNQRANSGPMMFAWYAQGFSDPLGDRLLLFDNTSGAPLELLRLRPELSRVAGFEAAVRRRASELRDFQDSRHARVCRVDRLPDPGGGLAVVSSGTQGQRLSDLLLLAEQRHLQPGGDIVRRLVSEIVAALAAFHAAGEAAVHGALGPQRLAVSPDGELLVTEYVLGSALALVPLDRPSFWRSLRLAVPADPALPAFSQRTDVLQVGTIALSLVLGRTLTDDDYPGRLMELVSEADDRLLLGGWGRLAPPFRRWLLRMLQIDLEPVIGDGIEAHYALQEAIAADPGVRFGAGAVEAFIRACTHKQGAPHSADALAGRDGDGAPRALPPADDTDTDEFNPFGEGTGEQAAAAPPSPPSLAPARSETTGPNEPGARDSLDPGELRLLPAKPDSAQPLWKQVALIALAIVAVAEALFIGVRQFRGAGSAASSTAIVNLDSNPGQATVLADGKRVGVTPLKLELRGGRHVLEVVAGDRHRTIAVTATPGTTTSHYVDLPAAQPQVGTLRVVTGPPGGQILVDGQPAGVSPVLVPNLAPGKHEVVVQSRDGRVVRQSVDIEQNSTASLFVPLPGAVAPAPGWLSISAPLDLNVYEDGELLGTSKSARIMLTAGRHELQLTADAAGFRTTREVQVPVGKTVALEVTVPSARLNINALPWAEVLIDNQRIGETPLSGVAVPIGTHLVTFRHPELGERTIEYLVTLQGPSRLSVDLRK